MKFSEINQIKKELIESLSKNEIFEMRPIQEKVILPAINGYDIIAQSKTGTGKTFAFVIPILNMLDNESKHIEHVVIAPTRELANQIYDQFLIIGKNLNVKLALIVGGISYEKQIKVISKKPNILIATPGRIIEYLKNKRINLNNLKTFALDESDELLNMGFKEDVDYIVSCLPKKRQNFFFSATFDDKVKKFALTIINNKKYKNIELSKKLEVPSSIKQEYILVKEKNKFMNLIKILDYFNPKSIIIFGKTKRRVEELTNALKKSDFNVAGLHGDMKQNERKEIILNFKNKKINILVATDLLSRGIHINDVEWIINFDLPQDMENYIHRIGRSGRNEKKGYSLSFVKKEEVEYIKEIEKKTNSKILEFFLPSEEDIYINWRNNKEKDLETILIKNKDNPIYLEEFLNKKFDKKDLVNILSFMLLDEKHKLKKVVLTPEPPIIMNKNLRKKYINKKIKKFLK